MIVFLDKEGNVIASSAERIGRNSNDASIIYIVGYIPASAIVYMTFTLPNGKTLFGGLAGQVSGDQAPQQANLILAAEEVTAWRYSIPSSVTALSGVVDYDIYIQTGSMLASTHGTFTVSKGNKITLPPTPTEDAWGKVLSALSSVEVGLSDLFGFVGYESGATYDKTLDKRVQELEEPEGEVKFGAKGPVSGDAVAKSIGVETGTLLKEISRVDNILLNELPGVAKGINYNITAGGSGNRRFSIIIPKGKKVFVTSNFGNYNLKAFGANGEEDNISLSISEGQTVEYTAAFDVVEVGGWFTDAASNFTIKAVGIDTKIIENSIVNTKSVEFEKTENYRIRGDGEIIVRSDYYYTDLIYLAKGERLYVEARMPNSIYSAIVSIWSDENTFVRTLVYGDTGTEFTCDYIAEGDCYIRLCGYNGYKMEAKISAINELNYSFAEGVIKETAKEVSRDFAVVSSFSPNYSKIANKYILDDGAIGTSDAFYYSSLIELRSGQVLSVVSEMPNNNRYAVVSKWSAEGFYVGTLFCPRATGLQTFTYTATEEFEYIRLCGYDDLTLDAVIKEIFEDNLEALKKELGIETINTLKGKKWDCFGDSLTAPGTLSGADNYTNIIADKNGMDMQNNAVGGKGYWNGILAELDNLRSDTDIVTIFGSFNDISSNAFPNSVGTKADTPSASGSLCARMRNIIETIISVNPSIKIGIITPTPWHNYNYFSSDADTYTRLETYVATLKEIASVYGIPVLDLFHESNMKPWVETFNNTYYKLNWDGTAYTGGDGVHPNTLGHKLFIAPRVEAWMKTL